MTTFGSNAPDLFASHDAELDTKTEAMYYEMEPADLHSEYMGNNDGTELDTDFATDTIEEKLYDQRQLRIDRQSDTTRINNMSDNFFSFSLTLLAIPGMHNCTTNNKKSLL
jgi:hypothetical protein